MRAPFVIATAAALLASSASLALAANTNNNLSDSTSIPKAADILSLNSSQQKTVWKDISSQATKEMRPVTFTAKVGAAVPEDVTIHPVPVSTANKVPAVRPYDYALLSNKKLLIVNPSDRKVAEIITQ